VSWLLTKLEVATRPWHLAVDRRWHELHRPGVMRADYLEALVETFGFVAPLESACKYTTGLDRWLGDRPLTRAGLIAQDLVALGMPPALMTRVPQCEDITTFRSVPEALGWLYLVERAAIVRDGLQEHLVARVPNLEVGCSFLAATDGCATERLAGFGAKLERAGDAVPEILASARDAFACAHRWTMRADRAARNAS
jgi:heme oxygenase